VTARAFEQIKRARHARMAERNMVGTSGLGSLPGASGSGHAIPSRAAAPEMFSSAVVPTGHYGCPRHEQGGVRR
jgi:hypothetical protein